MPFGIGEAGGEGALALAMLEAITDPALLIDAHGTVLAVNAAAAQAWPGLVEGRFLSMTLRSPDILSAVEAVLRGQRQARVDVIERVPVERVYQLTVSALSDVKLAPPKRQPAAMLVFRDLTEARRLEMMRVDFVANASHELRTPLASLLGFVETLQGPARNDEKARARFLDIMRTQAQRMARLIDDLLSLSRIEMSEHRRPENPVDLAAVARQMADTLAPLAQERGVALQLHAPDGPADRGRRIRRPAARGREPDRERDQVRPGRRTGGRFGGTDRRRRWGASAIGRARLWTGHRARAPAAPDRAVLPRRCRRQPRQGRHGPRPRDRQAHRQPASRPAGHRKPPRRRRDVPGHDSARTTGPPPKA